MAKPSGRVHPFAVKFTEEISPVVLGKLSGPPFRGLSPRQEYFFGLFEQWLEINSSLSSLGLSQKFLSGIRPRRVNADVIAYHVEKHLEETYILHQRVDRFFKSLERRLKKKGLVAEVQQLSRLRQEFQTTLKRLIGPRHEHVHQRRFLDRDIGQLGVIDDLLRIRENKDLKRHREPLARKVLQKWRRIVRSRDKRLSEMVDNVLQGLDSIIFEKLPPPRSPMP